MGQQFCWSAFISVPFQLLPLRPSVGAHRHTHTKVIHALQRYTHSHTDIHTDKLVPTYLHTWACTLSGTHTHTYTLLNTPHISFSLSFSLSHTTPCLSTQCQAICCLYSFPVFVSSSCSLQSLFHSKQNEMKSNTDLIWLLQENLNYVLLWSTHFPSQISRLALMQRWNITCQVFLRHTFFWRNWK